MDHDVVKVHNLNRSPLLSVGDVGGTKVEACARFLADSGQAVECHALEVAQYLAKVPRKQNSWDVVLPEANEHSARWIIQNCVPPLMIHGTTGPDWDVTVARHIPLREPCLACRFPRDREQPVMACGSGAVPDADGAEVHAALPFASTLAAGLALAELLKLGVDGYPHNSPATYVHLGGQQLFTSRPNTLIPPGCICREQGGLFGQFNGQTLFADLSHS